LVLFFVHLLVDSVLLVVVYPSIDALVCGKHCCTYIGIIFFLCIFLQENIGAVTVERVENVGEEDCSKIKTEGDYIQLVRTVKSEEEVSVVCVFCGSDLFTGVCACVLYCALYFVAHSCRT
jgi:hypothetical protein